LFQKQLKMLVRRTQKNDNIYIVKVEKSDLSIYESNWDKINVIGLWFKNTLHQKNNSKLRKDEYEYCKYKNSLTKVAEIDRLYKNYLSDAFNNLNDLNNYVHGNGEKYIFENHFDSRKLDLFNNHLYSLQTKLEDVILCYLSTLIILSPGLLISDDYFSAIESGLKPDDRLQTTIAPIFQIFFNEFGKTNNVDLVKYLNTTNKYRMVIE